jgi:hypothetical protein
MADSGRILGGYGRCSFKSLPACPQAGEALASWRRRRARGEGMAAPSLGTLSRDNYHARGESGHLMALRYGGCRPPCRKVSFGLL